MKTRATKFFQDYFKLADEDVQSCMYDDTIDCMVKFAESEMNPDVGVECEHPFAYVHTRCMGEINHCLKCGKDL